MKRRLALGQKKSKEAFKRQLRVNATLCASFGIITVQLRNHFETSDFASGFLLGIAIALLSGSRLYAARKKPSIAIMLNATTNAVSIFEH